MTPRLVLRFVRRFALWAGLAVVVVAAAGFGGWLLSLPAAPGPVTAPEVPAAETRATLDGLRPARQARPLVAVVGINEGTETTDYLTPTGILRRADVADVLLLATGPGPVTLYPALKVEPDATLAAFDAAHPEGADYVVVPAMRRDDDPAVLAWLRTQAEKGARVIGICAGAKVVAAAGLLDGKRATTHWYYLREMLGARPGIAYVADRRIVSDGAVTTTTGITASMPMTLTLIEAIAGADKAAAVARTLGIERWDTRHASGAFKLTRPFATTVLANRVAFWRRDEIGVALHPGVDEVSLALVMDAWSRTYRSTAQSLAASAGAVETANGVRVLPDAVLAGDATDRSDPDAAEAAARPPARALDATLAAIATRYGAPTSDVVAMQLEYPR